MRTSFENVSIIEMNYGGYVVTMNANKCFEIRKESNNFLVLETSNKEDIDWVRNYINKLNKIENV
jgi:hypothetical protein